ncbi:uncharacterized protein VTP21DRAFT_5605 [Calcarisporiella thermophila]|uniref:uncharacterized protein n=1 Tax=Calcarisporiella thermophila TaxID=911321 RepID=UPI0037437CDD
MSAITETFHGYIETTHDTLLIYEACHRQMLPRVTRRLQEKERAVIRSGSVFVFDERESGIKRWTDGRVWSPSRILGNFLIYRELDKRGPCARRDLITSPERVPPPLSNDPEARAEREKERSLVGSLTNSYLFKKSGLIKKTMSVVVHGVSQHLISYYTIEDVKSGRLRRPSSVPELAGLEISPLFLLKQNFRVPPLIDAAHPMAAGEPRSPTGAAYGYACGGEFGGGHGAMTTSPTAREGGWGMLTPEHQVYGSPEVAHGPGAHGAAAAGELDTPTRMGLVRAYGESPAEAYFPGNPPPGDDSLRQSRHGAFTSYVPPPLYSATGSSASLSYGGYNRSVGGGYSPPMLQPSVSPSSHPPSQSQPQGYSSPFSVHPTTAMSNNMYAVWPESPRHRAQQLPPPSLPPPLTSHQLPFQQQHPPQPPQQQQQQQQAQQHIQQQRYPQGGMLYSQQGENGMSVYTSSHYPEGS